MWWHDSDFPAGEHFNDDDLYNDENGKQDGDTASIQGEFTSSNSELKTPTATKLQFLLELVAQNSDEDRDKCQGFSCIDSLARHNGAKTTILRFMVMAISRATPSPPQSNMQSFLPHGPAATRWHELISSGQWWLSKSAALRHATAMVVLWSFVTATLRAARGSGKTPAKTRTLFT